MATGIFFFDKFLSDESVSHVFCLFVPLVIVLIVLGLRKSEKQSRKHIFGIMASVCFFLLGGVLVLNERSDVEYKWNDKECLYYGKLLTTPEDKGKSLCSTVNIISGIAVEDSSLCYINRDVLLYWLKDSTVNDIKCGDKVVFYSRISEPVSDIDFMGFDYRHYLLTKGISGTGFVFPSNMMYESCERVASFKERALQCRDSIVRIYSGWKLDDENMAVISALTIGDKSGLSPELKAMYSAAGTSHVLALSGLHIGIFSAILYILLWPLKKIRNGSLLQSVIVAMVLWTFAFVSGLSPSVVRAVTMCTLYLMASLLVENGLSGLYSLTFTAFIMLLYQPLYLFDISFQLSFVAVFSIILFFPYFNSLVKCKNKILKYIWGILVVSISAQLGTLPLILFYFGSFPTYFLIANLIVSPLAVCILSLTLASLLLMWVPYVGDFCIYALNMSTRFLNSSMSYICGMEGSQITSIHVNDLQMVILFVLTGCFYLYLQRRRAIHIIMMLCTIIARIVRLRRKRRIRRNLGEFIA